MSKKQKKPANDKGAAPKPKRVRAEKPKAEKRISVKTIVRDAFLANPAITNDEVVAAVKKARPDSKFNEKQAQWYRWMAKSGTLTGTAIEMPKQPRKKAAAK